MEYEFHKKTNGDMLLRVYPDESRAFWSVSTIQNKHVAVTEIDEEGRRTVLNFPEDGDRAKELAIEKLSFGSNEVRPLLDAAAWEMIKTIRRM